MSNPYRARGKHMDYANRPIYWEVVVDALAHGERIEMIEAEGEISHDEMISGIREEYQHCKEQVQYYTSIEQWDNCLDFVKACKVITDHFDFDTLDS